MRRGSRARVASGRPSSSAVARGSTAARAAALAAGVFIAVLQVHRLDDGDTWWHLASGRLIAATGAVARTDPFSYTAAGAPWLNRQWLFDLGAYAAWWLGGSALLALAAGALFLIGFACLYALARRRMPAWAAGALLFVAAQAAVERFTVRPEAVTFACLGLLLLLLDRRPLRARSVAAVIALQLVWANSHALSILGVGVLALELAGSTVGRWKELPAGWRAESAREIGDLRAVAIATGAAVVTELLTPFGLAGALLPLRLLGVLRGAEVTSAPIVEHRAPTLAELSPPVAVGLVALLALALVAGVLSLRRWRLSHVGVAAVFTVLALLARRNVALLAPGLVPLIADGLGPGATSLERRLASRPLLRRTVASGLVLVFATAAAAVVTGSYYDRSRLTRAFGLGESALLFPDGAVAFVDAHARDARIFNDDGLGGYLIWRRQPPRPVFIDGRLQVYPGEVYRDYEVALEDPRTFAGLAARYGVTAAILSHPAPGRLELAAAIARLPGWRIAYLDAGAVVLLADGAPAARPAGLDDAPTGARTSGAARLLEHVLALVRFPAEDAVAHYQRGRALLYLYGPAGIPAARADFEAALREWPALDDARAALRVTAPALSTP